jgi:hypothetical protein
MKPALFFPEDSVARAKFLTLNDSADLLSSNRQRARDAERLEVLELCLQLSRDSVARLRLMQPLRRLSPVSGRIATPNIGSCKPRSGYRRGLLSVEKVVKRLPTYRTSGAELAGAVGHLATCTVSPLELSRWHSEFCTSGQGMLPVSVLPAIRWFQCRNAAGARRIKRLADRPRSIDASKCGPAMVQITGGRAPQPTVADSLTSRCVQSRLCPI